MERMINYTLDLYKNNLNIDQNQEAILKYGIYLFYTYILGFVSSLILAYFLGIFPLVLVMILSISVLRNYSGGAHCSSMRNCILFSTITVNILGLFLKNLFLSTPLMLMIVVSTLVFSLWAIGTYAPADSAAKPISSPQKRKRLRNCSYIIIFLWFASTITFYLSSDAVHPLVFSSTIGILWQSVSLPKFGYAFYHGCDTLLNKFFQKGGSYL